MKAFRGSKEREKEKGRSPEILEAHVKHNKRLGP